MIDYEKAFTELVNEIIINIERNNLGDICIFDGEYRNITPFIEPSTVKAICEVFED